MKTNARPKSLDMTQGTIGTVLPNPRIDQDKALDGERNIRQVHCTSIGPNTFTRLCPASPASNFASYGCDQKWVNFRAVIASIVVDKDASPPASQTLSEQFGSFASALPSDTLRLMAHRLRASHQPLNSPLRSRTEGVLMCAVSRTAVPKRTVGTQVSSVQPLVDLQCSRKPSRPSRQVYEFVGFAEAFH